MRDGRMRHWLMSLLSVLGLMLAFAIQASDSDRPIDGEGFDCSSLATQPDLETPEQWFEHSLWASHCYVFQANAVRIGLGGVRTLTISHEVMDGVERETARFLDGPPVALERHGRIGRFGWVDEEGEAPASPIAIIEHLDGLYRLKLGEEERVANRRAIRLDIDPLDSFRFGHRLWLDMATGLALKQVLLDEDGRIVETLQMTEIESPRLHEGHVKIDPQREPPSDAWQLGWLPQGFFPLPVDTRSPRHGDEVVHRLYSDGLSTLSLFIEPIGDADLLIPGMHRLGVAHAAVRHRELDGRAVQVVVMGEMPPRVLLRVADTLEWPNDENATDSSAEPAS